MKYIHPILLLSIAFLTACTTTIPSREQVHELIDQWHRAAATADEETFFGSMTPDAIYLGTDASERWYRDELKTWSEKYFQRESAWDFKPFDREVYFSADGQYAWFEELLQTWMGTCRGSGVLRKSEDGWKITHYHLSVTIHNDLIGEFIDLVKKDPSNSYLENE